MDRLILDPDCVARLTDMMQDMQIIDVLGDAIDFITKYKYHPSESESEIIGAACVVADRVHDLMDAIEDLEMLKRG